MVMVGARSRRRGVDCLESSGSGLEFEGSDMIDPRDDSSRKLGGGGEVNGGGRDK